MDYQPRRLTARDLNATCPYAMPQELELVQELAQSLGTEHEVVMIGAGPGVFALAVLEGRRDPPYLHVIDHDTFHWLTIHLDAAECNTNQLDLVLGESAEVGREWQTPIDLLIVDGDHSYEGVVADLDAWWPHVKVGGYLFFHDYKERPGGFDGIAEWEYGGVFRAVYRKIQTVPHCWQFVKEVGISALFRKVCHG